MPACSGQFCKWCGQCLASFSCHCRVQLWLVTQLQCSHPRSLAHVVLYFSDSATAVCLAPGSSSSAVDSVLAPVKYSSRAKYYIMKGLGYEQGHVGKLCAACASGQALVVFCAVYHFHDSLWLIASGCVCALCKPCFCCASKLACYVGNFLKAF